MSVAAGAATTARKPTREKTANDCFLSDCRQTLHRLEGMIEDAAGCSLPEARALAQRLLIRLILWRFIEEKGWLCDPVDNRPTTLWRLWRQTRASGGSEYRNRLAPVLFGLPDDAAPAGTVVRMLLPSTAAEETSPALPEAALDELLAYGDGRAGLLYRHRFTLDESHGDDAGAVDPQVMGTIREEHLAGRRARGVYYTPRAVVAFMCREALKGYLCEQTAVPADAIAALVDQRDARGIQPAGAGQILAALDRLRALDPACGAGAFLVGLLIELAGLHQRLSEGVAPAQADVRWHIIAHCLHGMDRDASAVEIARVRLWLALAEASDEPPAVPTMHLARSDALFDPLSGDDGQAGAFDIVLANPPYVRHELLDDACKRRLRQRYGRVLASSSDLSAYFFVRAMELLRPGGMHVFICSNSWLDVAYGRRLQAHLLKNAHVSAVYQSAVERQFASAQVNTVITVLSRRSTTNRHTDDPPTRFVSLLGPFRHALADPAQQRVTHVPASELRADGKWGGRYLRAPAVYHTVLQRGRSVLVPLRHLGRIRRGYTTGANDFFCVQIVSQADGIATIRSGDGSLHTIEQEYVRQPVVVKTSHIVGAVVRADALPHRLVLLDEQARLRPHAGRYIAWGEMRRFHLRPTVRSRRAWFVLDRREPAHVLVPIGHDRRPKVALASGILAGDNLVEVTLRDPAWATLVAGALYSTFGVLACEITGRANFGQGLLKTQTYEIAELPVPDPARLDRKLQRLVVQSFQVIAARPALAMEQEVRQPDRAALDEAILAAAGFADPAERHALVQEIHTQTLRMVRLRTEREAGA